MENLRHSSDLRTERLNTPCAVLVGAPARGKDVCKVDQLANIRTND